MRLFSGGDTSTFVDASTKIQTTADSYNTTTSFSQGFSDIGSTRVTFPGETPLQTLQPLLLVGGAALALVFLTR